MGRRMLAPGGLVLLLLLPGMAAFAQTTPLKLFELERLELNPGAEGSLIVGMGELLQAGQFRTSAVAHYSHRPLMLFREGKATAVVGGRSTMHVSAAYSLTNWLQVEGQLPLVLLQQLGPSAPNPESPKSFVLGTPTVGLRLGLLTQDEQGGVDLAVGGDVGLPVGSMDAYARDAGLRVSPRVMVGRRFGFFRAALDAGLMVRPGGRVTDVNSEILDELGNELRIGAALVTTGRRMRWEFNVRGMVPLSQQPGSVEVLPGVRYLVNPSLEVFALAGVGMGKTPGTPLFRVLAGGSFGDVTPRRGPKESSVRCDMGLSLSPEECPEKDDDGDGVRNLDDKCPLVAGDPARAGCSRTDTDSDGIEDSLDACPTERGDAARQGCPVRDQDNDGVADEDDACVAEAGPAENRGCPAPDRDKDGIHNDDDACPDEPGPPERQGCPEEDTDKDGVPNREDTCVHESGPQSNLGCPEHEVPQVVIKPRQLELRGKVFFEASQARIQQRSFVVLDWVAKVLREHPELPRVVVGAHTDDRGFAEQNRQLSQQRAEVVRRYLIDKGVAAERLDARGYGPDKPVDSNATSIGRENNRRVDFMIIRDGDESSAAPRK
ncbi:OmpA family protein [Vitiosangium sp. GDMCC 1.1324]|uniref:OmpA family protein n=1 Tax=Vitiosangium sp. (strain GDMCC 1.1324) TaxID=2138576 RepID=UPI000D3B4492|nr:OmpA family protein [Vitiosangium sp. GDMCC 1.1324]PTL83678.1 cell envelope biogenesis protein OmpA [Vitiosangium sp. GDMCC 1.1324]